MSLVIGSRERASRDRLGRVVRVERTPGEERSHYDVGVRFLDPPPPARLAGRRGKSR